MENVSILREELHDYINKADDRLLKLAHALLSAGLEEENDFEIPDEHKNIIEERLEEYKRNPPKTISAQDALDRISKKI